MGMFSIKEAREINELKRQQSEEEEGGPNPYLPYADTYAEWDDEAAHQGTEDVEKAYLALLQAAGMMRTESEKLAAAIGGLDLGPL